MKEELQNLLGQDSNAVRGVNDVFKLAMQGRIISCCARVDTSALEAIFAVSGKTWVFGHPLSREAPRFPVVWANESWPRDLGPLYTRAIDSGAVGLALGDRHIGYRCLQGKDDHVRASLGVQPKTAWLLSGIPLSFAFSDAQGTIGRPRCAG